MIKRVATRHPRPVMPITADELRLLQTAAKNVLGWTLDTVAEKAECSTTELKFIRQGRRVASVALTLRLRKVENDVAFCARDSEALDAQIIEWVIQVLERCVDQLTVEQQARLKRIARREHDDKSQIAR